MSEQRIDNRLETDDPQVWYRTGTNPGETSAEVVDISPEGVCIRTQESLIPEESIELQIEVSSPMLLFDYDQSYPIIGPSRPQNATLEGTVRHVRPDPAGNGYLVGLQLHNHNLSDGLGLIWDYLRTR